MAIARFAPQGFWPAIPTPAAGKSTKGGRITPGEWERRTGLRLRFVYRRRGPSLLVAEGRLNSKGRAVASKSKTGRGVATEPIFLQVPQVKLRKRLNLAWNAEWAGGRRAGVDRGEVDQSVPGLMPRPSFGTLLRKSQPDQPFAYCPLVA